MPTPAADSQSFLLSNIVAQNPHLNCNLWNAIEKAERALATHRSIYTVTGVLFKGRRTVRLNNRVMIPTHIYKLVLDLQRNMTAVHLVENQAGRRHRGVSAWKNWLASCFFPNSTRCAPVLLPILQCFDHAPKRKPRPSGRGQTRQFPPGAEGSSDEWRRSPDCKVGVLHIDPKQMGKFILRRPVFSRVVRAR